MLTMRGRPKQHKKPKRVNLILDEAVKKSGARIAFQKGISFGQFISQLILKAEAEAEAVK